MREGAIGAGPRPSRVGPWAMSFAMQGVVVHPDGLALDDSRVDPDAVARGFAVAQQSAGLGQQVPRILGVDAALDGVTLDVDVLLPEGQRLAAGDP